MENETHHRLLSRPQAAAYLGIQPTTLAVWASTGRNGLPYVKVGSRVQYRRSDLDAFIEANLIIVGATS